MMKKVIITVILLFITFLYTRPYFRPGFFSTHDGEWAIVRLSEMWREIKDGQVPPRLSDYLNHGFGYPLFSFTYPAPYYLGAIVKLLGFGFTDSVKILFAGSVVLAAFFMYLLGRELVGEFGGILAAIFYTAAPFRLVDLYIRGSLGESLEFTLFPAIFLFTLKYIRKPNSARLILCSSVFALLILTHNITAFLFFPLFIGFLYVAAIFYKKNTTSYSWRYFLPLVVLSLGLSAYFFLPAVLEKKYLFLSTIRLADASRNFVRLTDYVVSKWNYDVQPSYQLGLINIAAALIGLIVLFIYKQKSKKYRLFFWFIILTIGVLIFFASSNSAFFWGIPPLSWFDFPWRLLTPLTFIVSFATIFLGLNLPSKIIGCFLAILAVLLNLGFTQPKGYINQPDVYYATNDATTTSMDELMPIWVTDKPKNRYREKVETVQGQASISDLSYNSKMTAFHLDAQAPSTIKINTIYFPGWQIRVNGKGVPIDYNNPQGVMHFSVNPGDYQVAAKFTETPIRLLSDWISIVSFGIVIILLIKTYENIFK